MKCIKAKFDGQTEVIDILTPIKYTLNKGKSIKELEEEYNISKSSINGIRYNRTWTHVKIDEEVVLNGGKFRL